MEEEFDVITLTGDDGRDADFELVDAVEHGGKKYCVLFPKGMTPEEREEEDPVILEYVTEDGEDFLEEVADEDEWDEVFGLYLRK